MKSASESVRRTQVGLVGLARESDMQKRLPYLDAGKAISKVLMSRWRASKWL
jgi:hypothetical protein